MASFTIATNDGYMLMFPDDDAILTACEAIQEIRTNGGSQIILNNCSYNTLNAIFIWMINRDINIFKNISTEELRRYLSAARELQIPDLFDALDEATRSSGLTYWSLGPFGGIWLANSWL